MPILRSAMKQPQLSQNSMTQKILQARQPLRDFPPCSMAISWFLM